MVNTGLKELTYIFFFFLTPTSIRLHPLHCCRNSRLVVDEDDNGKYRLERVNIHYYFFF